LESVLADITSSNYTALEKDLPTCAYALGEIYQSCAPGPEGSIFANMKMGMADLRQVLTNAAQRALIELQSADQCVVDGENLIDTLFMAYQKYVKNHAKVNWQDIFSLGAVVVQDGTDMYYECANSLVSDVIRILEEEYVKHVKVSSPSQCSNELAELYPLGLKIA